MGLVCNGIKVVEKCELYRNVYAMFFKSLYWVINTICLENKSPILKISSYTKIDWGNKI